MFETQSEYCIVYYSLITIFLIWKFVFGRKCGRKGDLTSALILSLLLAILFGSRPIDVGSDTLSYSYWFDNIKLQSFSDVANFTFGKDPILKLLFWIFGSFAPLGFVFGVVSGIMTFLCYVFSRKVCELTKKSNGFVLFLFTLYSFTVFNFEINIIRAGLGAAFWALFSVYLFKNDIRKCVIFGFLAAFTHFSTIIFILAVLGIRYFRFSINKYVFLILICLVLAYVGFSLLRFVDANIFNIEKTSVYTDNIDKSAYKVGFRPEFALFNMGFLLIPIFLKNYLGALEKYYVRLYVLCSVIFFMWFAIPYSDRIGAYSWFIIPTIIYLPLVNKYGNSGKIAFGCFAYGLINYCI